MDDKVKALLEKHKHDKDLTTEKDYIKPGWDWSGADLEEWNLKGIRLSDAGYRANFEKAKLGTVNLQEAKLSCADLQEADLCDANLQRAALEGANLQKAVLVWANLQKASLVTADLQKAVLYKADLQGADLDRADLQKANLVGANLQKADLTGSDLRDAVFSEETILKDANLFQCELENSTIKNAQNQLDKIAIQEREKKYSEARDVYLILKNYFREEGMYDTSGEYYYRERVMERACNRENREWGKWFLNHLLEEVAGYGERPGRVVMCWVAIILLSAAIYLGFEGIMVGNDIGYVPNPREALYFSGVTFTTLGFGDLAPKPGVFQLFAFGEALLGAIFMAMFIFVFARKMTR